MINVIITFRIKPSGSLEFVQEIIRTFIIAIRQNEPNTLSYRSFQGSDDPRSFCHVMTFTNSQAQELHRASSYCATFVSQLYPLCVAAPQARRMEEINPL